MVPAGPAASDPEAAALARRVAEAPGRTPEEEAQLCRLFAPRIRRYGLRHLRDADRADDLVQQVLLVTIEKLRAGAVRDCGQIASFVLGVSRMVARDMRRADWKRERLTEAFALEQDVSALPADPIDQERLHGCLGGLMQRDRLVVLLSFYAEASAADIARDLALSPANVRVIRHRAMARLRDCLQRHPGGAAP